MYKSEHPLKTMLQRSLLFAALGVLGTFTSLAQQDVLTGQYLFNGTLINPAYAGASGQWETMAMQRLQWVEFDGAPNTGILSAHGAIAVSYTHLTLPTKCWV